MPFYYYPMSSAYILGYLLVAIGAIIMIYAQIKVNKTYSKYEKVPNSRGITGAMVAREILDRNGLSDIKINRGRVGNYLIIMILEIELLIYLKEFLMGHRLLL